MNSKLLEDFIRVYEHQSITKAANILGVSQSNITKSIKKLEEQLSLQLFHRHTREIRPTEAADSLYITACQSLKANELFLEKARTFKLGEGVSISIGCGPLAHDLLLKPLIKKVLEKNLDIRISFRTGDFSELKEGLDKHEFDLIFYDVGELGVVSDPTNYEVVSLAKDDIYIVANHDHPIHQHERILDHLSQYKWVLPPIPQRYISTLSGQFKTFLLDSRQPSFEVTDIPQAQDLAEECDLITIAVGDLTKGVFPRRKLEVLDLPFSISSNIGYFRLRTRFVPPALKSILELL